jgi:hypothetical protein
MITVTAKPVRMIPMARSVRQRVRTASLRSWTPPRRPG